MREILQEGTTISRQARLRAVASYAGRAPLIGQARGFAGAFLDRAAVRGVPVAAVQRGDALLVVSELVTNAVRHAPGPCTLALALHGALLEIAVSDTSRQPPRPQPHDPHRIGQHGLEIVVALCDGVAIGYTDRGKTVRAHILVL